MLRAAIGIGVLAVAASCLDFDKFEGDAGTGGAPASSATVAMGGSGGMMIPVSCTNDVKDTDESDIDCGGICPDCANGKSCLGYNDCLSQFCNGATCAACTGDPDCAAAPNSWCDAAMDDGTCVAKRADGEACAAVNQCMSGACADGLCCNTACTGACQACVASKSIGADGTCAPVIGTTDPDDDCSGPDVCNGSGSCAALCSLAPPPPGSTNCPTVCTGGCNNGQCIVNCTGQSCQGQVVNCPDDYSCLVQCGAANSCQNAVVNCPDNYACDISCTGNSACRNATISCSATGLCALTCGSANQACRDSDLNCGSNACTATCSDTWVPTVTCGTSCSCTPC
jgi:hypothetical protein